MKNMTSFQINSEKTDCRTMCQVNFVNASGHEMTEENDFGMDTSSIDPKIPLRNEKKNDRIRSLISWGDREYEIDEFRSLLLKGPIDSIE